MYYIYLYKYAVSALWKKSKILAALFVAASVVAVAGIANIWYVEIRRWIVGE